MIFRFADYFVDIERLELTGPSGPIALQPQAFALLQFLMENSDRVVTKDEIFDAVWQGRIVGDGTLNARINAIRTAVGDDGTRQEIVKTLPRQGFRFVAELMVDEDPVAIPEGEEAVSKSVGILPFTDIGNDPEQAYFADGLTEDLITDLSKVNDLFVIARNTSFSFKGSSKSTVEIGQEMGVAYVLEGSVRRVGGRIRINTQLVATESGGSVWAERYDRDFSDIFAVQDDITTEITSALQLNLTQSSGTNFGASAETYELCLRARALFFKFQPEAFNQCVALLDKAVEIDPNYSRAWAEQVFPYQSGHTFGFPGFDDGLRIAIEKGQRAVELKDTSGFAHSRLAWALTISGQHEPSLKHFRRAVELEPKNAEVYAWYCEALNFAGEPEKAIDVAETCLHFDPIAPANVLHHLGHARFLLGEFEAAIELEARVARVMPSFPPGRIIATAALVETNRQDEAREQIEAILDYNPDFKLLHFQERYPYKDQAQLDRISKALIAAGLT